MFVFQGDVFCDDCGRALRAAISAEGKAPQDQFNECSFSSDVYPKGPYPENGVESDTPEHCASGESCFNAIELPSGCMIGTLLETDLTTEGVEYVKKQIKLGGEVAEFWDKWFSYCGYILREPMGVEKYLTPEELKNGFRGFREAIDARNKMIAKMNAKNSNH